MRARSAQGIWLVAGWCSSVCSSRPSAWCRWEFKPWPTVTCTCLRLGLFMAAVWWVGEAFPPVGGEEAVYPCRDGHDILPGNAVRRVELGSSRNIGMTAYRFGLIASRRVRRALPSPTMISAWPRLPHEGEPDKAMKEYRGALRLDPDNRLANVSYGDCRCSGRADRRKRQTIFARALGSDPDFGEAHENMGTR